MFKIIMWNSAPGFVVISFIKCVKSRMIAPFFRARELQATDTDFGEQLYEVF